MVKQQAQIGLRSGLIVELGANPSLSLTPAPKLELARVRCARRWRQRCPSPPSVHQTAPERRSPRARHHARERHMRRRLAAHHLGQLGVAPDRPVGSGLNLPLE